MESKAPQPTQIHGIITAEQANILHDEVVGSPASLEIVQGLGADALEATGVAIALTPGEEGVDPRYDYVSLLPADLGTRITNPDTLEKLSLPPAQEAHDTIKAKEAEFAEKSETTEPSEFAALLGNPNDLLKPEALNLLRNFGELPEKISQLYETDNDTANQVADAATFAKRHIFGPEQGVEAVHEIVKKQVGVLSEELQMFTANIGRFAEDLNGRDRSAIQLADELPGVQRLASELKYAVESGQPITEEQLYHARRLQEFAYNYADMNRKLETEIADQQVSAGRAYAGAGELIGTAQTSAKYVEGAANEVTFAIAQDSDVPELVDKVIERGATTIADHMSECQTEADAEHAKMSDLARSTRTFEAKTHQLVGKLNNSHESFTSLPHRNQLVDAAEFAVRYLGNASRGEMSIQYAHEFVDQIDRLLHKIEYSLNDLVTNRSQAAALAEEISRDASLLQLTD